MTATAVHVESQSAMAQVRVEPLGETLCTVSGETLLRAAQRAGLRWPTICQGAAICGACFCRVTEASEQQAEPGARELKGLRLVSPHLRGPDVRLACQLVPRGTLTVERAGVAAPAARKD